MIGVIFRWGRISRVHANFRRQIGDTHARGIQARQLMQGDVFQSAPNRGIDALPGGANAAQSLDPALAGSPAAFGNGDRPLEYIEDLRGSNFVGPPREAITALRTA